MARIHKQLLESFNLYLEIQAIQESSIVYWYEILRTVFSSNTAKVKDRNRRQKILGIFDHDPPRQTQLSLLAVGAWDEDENCSQSSVNFFLAEYIVE